MTCESFAQGRVLYSPMCYPTGGVVDDLLVRVCGALGVTMESAALDRNTSPEQLMLADKLKEAGIPFVVIEKNADGVTVNRWNTFGFLASSAANNETGYISHKVLRSLGAVAFDTQARI